MKAHSVPLPLPAPCAPGSPLKGPLTPRGPLAPTGGKGQKAALVQCREGAWRRGGGGSRPAGPWRRGLTSPGGSLWQHKYPQWKLQGGRLHHCQLEATQGIERCEDTEGTLVAWVSCPCRCPSRTDWTCGRCGGRSALSGVAGPGLRESFPAQSHCESIIQGERGGSPGSIPGEAPPTPPDTPRGQDWRSQVWPSLSSSLDRSETQGALTPTSGSGLLPGVCLRAWDLLRGPAHLSLFLGGLSLSRPVWLHQRGGPVSDRPQGPAVGVAWAAGTPGQHRGFVHLQSLHSLPSLLDGEEVRLWGCLVNTQSRRDLGGSRSRSVPSGKQTCSVCLGVRKLEPCGSGRHPHSGLSVRHRKAPAWLE